jgi:(2S)-methylsuccinyl-CoA dehydrogenase
MQAFDSMRIDTAARAVGVAQAAMEHALGYSGQRAQFGMPIANFPRVSDKIAMMAADIAMARQLTVFAARQKDAGTSYASAAGMAELLAARAAWSAADTATQIHGGNGLSLEFPISRILCDARVFTLFAGSAEMLTQIMARRLLEAPN